MTTQSPGRADMSALAIAWVRSDWTRYPRLALREIRQATADRRRSSPGSASARIRIGILGPRVVGGEDREVDVTTDRLAHERTLAAVAVAAAPEDADETRRHECAKRPEDAGKRVRRVRA